MSQSFFFPDNPSFVTNFKGYKLIVPTVAVGNVAQLSLDLLISSLLQQKKLIRSGKLSSAFLRPVVGPNAYDIFSSNVTTSSEVYHSEELKLVLIQVRSPPFRETKKQLLDQLSEWIVSQGFDQVFVVTSSFSQFLSCPDKEGSRLIKYLASYSFTDSTVLSDLQPVSKVNPHSYQEDPENGVIKVPGSGIAKKLFEAIVTKDAAIKAILLIAYCSEGDNTPDAYTLSQWIVRNVMKHEGPFKFTTPVSWNKFFGDEIPNALF